MVRGIYCDGCSGKQIALLAGEGGSSCRHVCEALLSPCVCDRCNRPLAGGQVAHALTFWEGPEPAPNWEVGFMKVG